tara:strand:+ start:36 stop:290 length:255 start_codon:yes stop_codon:yes gene_type:complete
MIEIWGKPQCGYCDAAKRLCESRKFKFVYKQLGEDFDREQIFENFPGAKTFPQIKINDNVIGGYDEFLKYIEDTGYNGTGYSTG